MCCDRSNASGRGHEETLELQLQPRERRKVAVRIHLRVDSQAFLGPVIQWAIHLRRRRATNTLDDLRYRILTDSIDSAYLLGMAVGRRIGPQSLRPMKGGGR